MTAKFTPSPYQAKVFDFIQNGTGSAIVDAVAGSGKTTTIVKALELIPDTADTTFLAFNKKIAQELQARVPKHVKAATFHSQGFAAWRKFCGGRVGAPEGKKVRNLLWKNFSEVEASTFGQIAVKLVSIAKGEGVGILMKDVPETWFALADHRDLSFPEGENIAERAVECARRLLKLSTEVANALPSSIDFDDMLYMPLLKDAKFSKSDWLFVDESQDTNAVQLAILKKMLKPGGRLVAVGDPHQAIYGFRGADAKAIDNIRAAFNCITLPLSTSYRCSKAVVALAKTLVPHIEANANAPEGEVKRAQMHEVNFQPKDAVICRNTAPLIELAFSLVAKGTGCKVLGREIGDSLAALVKQMDSKDLEVVLNRLSEYSARECAKFEAKGDEQKADAVRDRVNCLMAIANNLKEGNRTVSALIDSIDALFSDDTGTDLLTLCTAHKSKGLEWETVYIHRPELMPSKFARLPWQIVQEENLRYVAYTRAKHTLVFIAGGNVGLPVLTASTGAIAAPAIVSVPAVTVNAPHTVTVTQDHIPAKIVAVMAQVIQFPTLKLTPRDRALARIKKGEQADRNGFWSED